jgi:hypothetical protein
MTNVRSWQFWVIVALALATMACAGRRERREEAREAKRERAEQKKADREGRAAERPAAAPAAALTATGTAPAAAAGDSKMVFMRPSGMGGAVAATVFDVTDSDSKIIGIINMRGRLSYPVKPGVYTFMVVSEAADFMQVTVAPGKTYYALVRPRMGAWKARFSFEPLRAGDGRAEKWEHSTSLITSTARAQNWFRDNAASVEDKRSRYWPEWSNKPESARAGQTLGAEDGH